MLLLPLRLDLAPHLVHRLILYFNPRTPVGCAPMQKYSTTVSKFQSTHPSGVRPGRHRLLLGRGAISIHAPQWGATVALRCGGYAGLISIHAPQWGATRPHEPLVDGVAISIHAPQWGATSNHALRAASSLFQSTHPSGVRHNPWDATNPAVLFQSTHPSGVRPVIDHCKGSLF